MSFEIKFTEIEMASISILSLPDHIIVDIFDHLSVPDLLSLTLVCKNFNDIISNSSKLLNKLRLNLNRWNIELKWIGMRKYSNIFFAVNYYDQYHSILFSLADGIKKLEIVEGELFNELSLPYKRFTIDHVKDLLVKTPNLKDLELQLPNKLKASEAKNKSKLTFNLDTLSGHINEDLLPMFYDCNVKNYSAEVFTCQLSNQSFTLLEFLMRQKNLESLKIKNYGSFETDALAEKYFGMKALKLIFWVEKGDKIENIKKFLLLHQNSLEYFSFRSMGNKYVEEILSLLPNFPHLKTLECPNEIKETKFNFNPIETVENLEILPNSKKHAIKFPNVKHLTVCGSFTEIFIADFTKLEFLTMKAYFDGYIPKSRAKKLFLINYMRDSRPFNFDDHGFEEIYVKDWMSNRKWILEFRKGGYDKKVKKIIVEA